jgi:hypothetical protein
MRYYEPAEPKHFDTRTVSAFLWTKKTINGQTRWLETAYWKEIFASSSWERDLAILNGEKDSSGRTPIMHSQPEYGYYWLPVEWLN